MKREEYTDDAICSAMWLGQFEPVGAEHVIRVLLKPSFHPEVCVTVEPARLHVAALHSQLWYESIPSRGLLKYHAATFLSADKFADIVAAFDRASHENASERKRAYADGMGYSALRLDGKQRSTFKGQPIERYQRSFIVKLLLIADGAATSVHLRNRIVQCGQHVGLNWDTDPEPEEPRLSRVLVLGTGGERADYFDQLRQNLSKRPPDKV